MRAPVHKTRCWSVRLRRELFWALALKLVVLLVLKSVFFPHRVPANEAAQGVADRIASPTQPGPETTSKEKP
ncbi:MAG: hypothetical protein Fur007_21390 [Rhodoferax sp.]